jgi:hypothetical protein
LRTEHQIRISRRARDPADHSPARARARWLASFGARWPE